MALQHSASAPTLKGRRLGREQIPLLTRDSSTPSFKKSQSSAAFNATRLPAAVVQLKFESWHVWRGRDIANFLDEFCGLPQYRTTAERNLNGRNLVEMVHYGTMNKGLARAGIVDFDHLRRIADDVQLLQVSSVEQLEDELHIRQSKRSSDSHTSHVAEQRLWAKHSRFKTPANNLCKQTFEIDRTEDVAIHWWRHRKTHTEMQKSASSGRLTDPYKSTQRMTAALNERPAVNQVLAETKRLFETGYMQAYIDNTKARVEAAEAAMQQTAARGAREEAARKESSDRQAREDNARREAEEAAMREAQRMEEERQKAREEAARKKEEKDAFDRLQAELRASEELERRREEEAALIKGAADKAKKMAAKAAKVDGDHVAAALKDLFDLNDLDGSGEIDFEESLTMNRKMAEGIGMEFDETAARATFAETDVNGDGMVSNEEFVHFSKAKMDEVPKEIALQILYQLIEVAKILKEYAS